LERLVIVVNPKGELNEGGGGARPDKSPRRPTKKIVSKEILRKRKRRAQGLHLTKGNVGGSCVGDSVGKVVN